MVFAFLSIALMTVDHRFHHLESVRSTLGLLLYPIQYTVDLPFRAIGWADESLGTRERLLRENGDLREENLRQHAELQKLEALREENARLRELLDASERLPERVSTAELLAVDLDPYRQEVVLNRGEADGVFVGQPLIDARGIMGQVIRINRYNATAMLISDPSHALPVQVNRTGLRTLAVGTGNPNLLELRHIPLSADVEEGDVVSTSGLGERFPPDYPVAEITLVERTPGEPFAVVEARPLAALDRSREVLLVWPANIPTQTPATEQAAQKAETPPDDETAAGAAAQ